MPHEPMCGMYMMFICGFAIYITITFYGNFEKKNQGTIIYNPSQPGRDGKPRIFGKSVYVVGFQKFFLEKKGFLRYLGFSVKRRRDTNFKTHEEHSTHHSSHCFFFLTE